MNCGLRIAECGLMALGLLMLNACDEAPAVNVTALDDCCASLQLGDPPETDVVPPLGDLDDPGEMCIGNNDGAISAAEMPTLLGACVTYSVNAQGSPVTVATQGRQQDAGYRWDFSAVPGLGPVGIEVREPQDYWFAAHFPEAEYATAVSLWQTDLLALFATAPDQVLMLGLASVASPDDTPQYTLLRYDEPLVVYQYPLTLGASWSQTVSFSNAVLQGVKNAGTETYEFLVDGRGTVQLPQFTLSNTLRVRLELEQTFVISQGQPTIRHTQFFFVHECLGEVARIVSQPDETATEFTTASEFRRLGF